MYVGICIYICYFGMNNHIYQSCTYISNNVWRDIFEYNNFIITQMLYRISYNEMKF